MIEPTVVVTGADRVVARFTAMPERVRATLRLSMRRWWYRLQSEVVTSKLSGDPLRRRTGNLASSINVGGAGSLTSFDESDSEIVGRVGTNVRYAAVHENGGTFAIPAHTRRMTSVFGRPVIPRDIEVRAHTATFPQRAFLRPVLRDMSSQIREGIKADIAASFEGT